MEKYWQPTRKKEYPNNILNITYNIDILSINLELLDKKSEEISELKLITILKLYRHLQ